MMIEQEMASIMKFLYDRNNVQLYQKRLKQDFERPSMYFPPPIIRSFPATVASYKNIYLWFVKVFDKDSEAAFSTASTLQTALMKKRLLVPEIDITGAETGGYIRLTKAHARELDDGVCQLEIDWNSIYGYEEEVFDKIMNFNFNTFLKEG